MPKGKVVLVTGASSGIGKSVAELLAAKGCRVYGTSRKQYSQDVILTGTGSGFLKMLQLDVCSGESVQEAVDAVMAIEGRIDVLVNNAGMGIAGSVEDTSTEEAFRQFNTNFFGVHRMVRQILPIMRKQGQGLIINISSVAAQFAIPFQSMYSASKAAIEAMSEALRIEAAPYGVRVALVEPGDTKTGFTDSRQFVAAAGEESPYREKFTKSVHVMIKDEMNGPEPVVVARAVWKTMARKNPSVRVVVGLKYKVFVFLKRLVPARFMLFILSKMY